MGSYMEILPASNPLSATERRTHDGFMSTFQDTAVKPVVHPDPLPFQYKAARNGCIPKSGPIKNTPFTRTPAFPIEKLKASLPKADVDPAVDHATIVSSCLKDLCDFESEIFTEEAVWRDLYALTGTLRTFHGSKHIRSCWGELSDLHHQSGFSLMAGTSMVVRLDVDCSWIQARYSFKTAGQPELICSGQIGIVPDGKSGWRIWLLTTILEEIKGLPNPDFMEPHTKRQTTDRTTTAPDLYQFDCVVVGAGFAGLCLAGRLKAMGVHSVTLERNANVGDNWTKRYESARFHTSKDYSDMPLGRIFTEEYPYFLSGQDLAEGYQKYANKHELNIWLSASLKSASFAEETRTWTLHVDYAGKETTITTPHFVLAIGAGGSIPKMPQLGNRELFKGTVIHSVDYKAAHQWKGKVGVIVGTANTAHDVAEDMLDAGLSSVTMIQRGRTAVFPIEYYKKWSDPLYNPTIPIEEADRQVMAIPIAITRHASIFGNSRQAAAEPERFDSLERNGFRVERYGDLWKLLSERLGGHYMDVGASAKVSAGLIKVKGDAILTDYTPTGLEFSNGSTLDADVIVFCTGFEHDVRKEAAKLIGPEIGDRLEDYWELDDEGELRGVYKPMSYPGIWYTGGGVTYARFYSRFLALQIAADNMGHPLKLYTKHPA